MSDEGSEGAAAAVALPPPIRRAPAPATSVPDGFGAALAEHLEGEVRFDAGSLGAYSTDASNFRQVPLGVVVPKSVEDAVRAVEVCARFGVPIVSRGGGTSLVGQTTNAAVVIDWSKYCNRLVSFDAGARRCVVEPGIVLDVLNDLLSPSGLRFGPEPATHPNCTLGGMIGNNSCGATAQRTGKVVDNVVRLEVLCYDGTRFWCEKTSPDQLAAIRVAGEGPGASQKAARVAEIYRQLSVLRDRYGEEIRRRYPDIARRVSGYNLDSLLDEHGFDVAGLLVGSESTLVCVLHAELALVPVVKARTLVVLGYDGIAEAADAVPAVLLHEPIALEGLDERLVHDEQIKAMHPDSLRELPEGKGWLMVQFGGEDTEEADARAEAMLAAIGRSHEDPRVRFFDDPGLEDELWEVRESGLGATAHLPGQADTWEGWEDSAVAPERLGAYLRDLEALYEEFGFASEDSPALYGHFGQGCVHTRIPFDLKSEQGVATYRRFLSRAAALVVSYGGSLSGEHGDGQGRGQLLEVMFGEELVRAFGELKAIFDPGDKMNPGKVVAAYPPEANLRLGADWHPHEPSDLFFSYPDDEGSFVHAALRCVGVGRCRQHATDNSVMCPSYQVTLEEEDATRGRARLLFEMLGGHGDGPIAKGWRSPEVRDALDLCFSCKGCKSDCPVNVDMATYKAEFLAHHYAGRLRPRAHYSLGWLPVLAQLVGRSGTAGLFNAIGASPARPLLAALGGVEDRELPLFAKTSFQRLVHDPARPVAQPGGGRVHGEVLLWPDTFTNFFHPHVALAATEVLERAGWRVVVPTGPVCCGLTWISTGQLKTARRVLERTAGELAAHVERGGLVVGLEPSCLSVFRSDAPDLLAHNETIERLARQSFTLAELLVDHTPGFVPPPLGRALEMATNGRRPTARGDTLLGANPPAVRALVQAHCHQHAVLGFDADRQLLEAMGLDAERLNSGCCGLAGNFGFEPGHLEVSRAAGERVLFPAVRAAARDDLLVADGFSCRTQVFTMSGTRRQPLHLAELLAAALRHEALAVGEAPEERLGRRPAPPSRPAQFAALAGALGVPVGGALGLVAARRRRR